MKADWPRPTRHASSRPPVKPIESRADSRCGRAAFAILVICAVVFQVTQGTAWRRRELQESCGVGAGLRVRSDE
jgi:hypothetical protein